MDVDGKQVAGAIISGIALGYCALMMIGIGIHQFRSKKPVGFYTGKEPPEEKDLSDVSAWNKKHGMMWIVYGSIIALVWVCGFLIGDTPLVWVPYIVGLLLPIPIMIWIHHLLVKKYVIK